jgi:hypothetical protein
MPAQRRYRPSRPPSAFAVQLGRAAGTAGTAGPRTILDELPG